MTEPQIIIYNTDDGKASVQLFSRDGSVWMNQSQLAELFSTSVPNISIHISNILKENELERNSVIKDYLITANDGKKYPVTYYSLDMILAIGFRVRSKRGTQFRQWANKNLKEYMVKGFVMDDERLKNLDGHTDYFDELLARIRDIRASEKRFYQKVRELFSLSSDYDSSDKATRQFFADTQNKLLFAITGQTAAELIISRADASQPNMALTSWKGQQVRKQDIYTAKNYLTADEIDNLNRLVVVFLETAELRAKSRQDITIDFWRENVGRIIELIDKPLLTHKGQVSHQQMEAVVNDIFYQFDQARIINAAQQADEQDQQELDTLNRIQQLETTLKERKRS